MHEQKQLPEESTDALIVSDLQEPETLFDATTRSHDSLLITQLRRGDEAAFTALLQQYHSTLFRLALVYVANRSVAEEVVQETWIGMLRSLTRFEGRCSLKTWIFRILMNNARTRAQREGRSIPFSSLDMEMSDEPTVAPERFLPQGEQYAGHWVSFPHDWGHSPEERLLSQETRLYIQKAVDALPPRQKEVITLRDIEGWGAKEVSSLLGLSEVNQRVLLHRARAYVRREIEQYFNDEGVA